jgi:hypothetical protein
VPLLRQMLQEAPPFPPEPAAQAGLFAETEAE